MMKFAKAALLLILASTAIWAQFNAGEQKSDTNLPFNMTTVTNFTLPWRLAFLPDGRMLITEKVGPVWVVTQQGEKMPVTNVPAVLYQGQGGMLGIYTSPRYATDHNVYLTTDQYQFTDDWSGFEFARLRCWSKAELYSGTQAGYVD